MASLVTLSGAAFAQPAQAEVPTAFTTSATSSNCLVNTRSADSTTGALTTTLATGNVSGSYDGTVLSGPQVDMAQTIAEVGTELGITPRGVRIAVAVAMQESSLNPHAVNAVYVGLYQQLTDPTSGLYTEYRRTDAIGAARMFFEQLVKRVPGYDSDSRTDWEIGEVVQETNVGQYVQKWEGLAGELTTKFVPGSSAVLDAAAVTAAAEAKAKLAAKKAAAKEAADKKAAKAKKAGRTAGTENTSTDKRSNSTSAASGRNSAVRISAEDLAPARAATFVRSANTRQAQIQPLRSAGGAFADVRLAVVPDGDGSGSSSVVSTEAPGSGQTGSGSNDSGSTGSGSNGNGSTGNGSTGTDPVTTTSVEVPTTSAPTGTDPVSTETGSTDVPTEPTSTPTDTPVTTPTDSTTTPPGSGTPTTTKPTTPSTSTSTPKPGTTTPVTTPSETGSKTPISTGTIAPPTTPETTGPKNPSGKPTDPIDPPVVPGPVDKPVPHDDTDPDLGSDPITVPTPPPGSNSGDCAPADAPDTNGGSTTFDPGRIISDEVFYNTKSMTVPQLRTFIDTKGADCTVDECLKNLKVSTTSIPADQYCEAYRGGFQEDVATILARVSAACGINPQVMLVTLQKESGLLTRTDVTESSYDAAWGWHCPDSGPGGTANCDPEYAGFFNQAYGMAKQWSRYKVDPQNYNYRAGQTTEILWNVAESGCGGAPVTIKNTATASLYNYTPYQPNAAALASYPAAGDECSAYGNRNFFFLFQKYFGVTGGGVPASISIKNGVNVTIPNSPYVTSGLAGAVVKAPNKKVAEGIAAGFASLGLPYVWGGGTNGGKADQGCSRGGGESNSCDGIVGFDCSGLTGYVLNKAGFSTGTNSDAQRSAGKDIPWIDALPGDIIGYSGHVAIYLGYINGTEYLLEAPDVGSYVQIRPVYRSNGGVPVDSVLHRYWT
ncbi:hypothetical protein D1871_23215 [Nakamurella silvestris]|nr:hypothetical protein D1871_23215 [Nakamurella silvestris]